MKWLVYAHYRLDTGECFYIGKGTEKRAQAKDCRNIIWKRIEAKAGRKIIVLQYFVNEHDALAFEVDLIAKYNPVANITAGGEGVSGLKHTDETKEKCRQATLKLRKDEQWLKNNLTNMREAVSKPESKAKVSKAKKDFFQNEQNRKHMSIKQSEFIKNNPEIQRLGLISIKNLWRGSRAMTYDIMPFIANIDINIYLLTGGGYMGTHMANRFSKWIVELISNKPFSMLPRHNNKIFDPTINRLELIRSKYYFWIILLILFVYIIIYFKKYRCTN